MPAHLRANLWLTMAEAHLDAERSLRILHASLKAMQTPQGRDGAVLFRDELEAVRSFVQQHRALTEPEQAR